MDTSQAAAIATAVGAISTATVVLGPLIRTAVEALKPTALVPAGYAGLAALVVGGGVGVLVGAVALAQGAGLVWLLVAVIAGLFGGVGAVVSDHAITGAAATTPDVEPPHKEVGA